MRLYNTDRQWHIQRGSVERHRHPHSMFPSINWMQTKYNFCTNMHYFRIKLNWREGCPRANSHWGGGHPVPRLHPSWRLWRLQPLFQNSRFATVEWHSHKANIVERVHLYEQSPLYSARHCSENYAQTAKSLHTIMPNSRRCELGLINLGANPR